MTGDPFAQHGGSVNDLGGRSFLPSGEGAIELVHDRAVGGALVWRLTGDSEPSMITRMSGTPWGELSVSLPGP